MSKGKRLRAIRREAELATVGMPVEITRRLERHIRRHGRMPDARQAGEKLESVPQAPPQGVHQEQRGADHQRERQAPTKQGPPAFEKSQAPPSLSRFLDQLRRKGDR